VRTPALLLTAGKLVRLVVASDGRSADLESSRPSTEASLVETREPRRQVHVLLDVEVRDEVVRGPLDTYDTTLRRNFRNLPRGIVDSSSPPHSDLPAVGRSKRARIRSSDELPAPEGRPQR
jgi:hypothetical protein